MKLGAHPIVHGLLAYFGVMVGLWAALAFAFYLILGPSEWNGPLGAVAWLVAILVLFEYKGGDLWQWLFPGAPRPRRSHKSP